MKWIEVDSMKKNKMYIFIGILVLILVFVVFLYGLKSASPVTEISFTELEQKIENKESFMLMIGAKTCPHCEKFKETITDVKKQYQFTLYYIDIDKLSDEQKSELKSHFPYTGTPTTINVVDGIEKNPQSRIDGALEYSIIKKRLISWGYIKED